MTLTITVNLRDKSYDYLPAVMPNGSAIMTNTRGFLKTLKKA